MTKWLNDREMQAWVRLASLLELVPGVLETQLKRDSGLSHFEYWVLAMLSEAPEWTLRMSSLANRTRGTLPPALARREPPREAWPRRAVP